MSPAPTTQSAPAARQIVFSRRLPVTVIEPDPAMPPVRWTPLSWSANPGPFTPAPREASPVDSDSDAEPSSVSYASIARRNAQRRASLVPETEPTASSLGSTHAPTISAAAAHQSAALSLAITRSLALEGDIEGNASAVRQQSRGESETEHMASRRALSDAQRQLRAAERTIAMLQSQIRIAQAGVESDLLTGSISTAASPSTWQSRLTTSERITLLVAEIARVRARLRPLESQAAAQAAALESKRTVTDEPPTDQDALTLGLVDADGNLIGRSDRVVPKRRLGMDPDR